MHCYYFFIIIIIESEHLDFDAFTCILSSLVSFQVADYNNDGSLQHTELKVILKSFKFYFARQFKVLLAIQIPTAEASPPPRT